MHRALACSSFYSCVFHRHFYCHRQTIKVCWTHACCPSAGCSSIKSIFLWKWVRWGRCGGVEADRKPSAISFIFYSELYKIRDPNSGTPWTGLDWPSDWTDSIWWSARGSSQRIQRFLTRLGKKSPYPSWEGRIPLVFTLTNSQTACLNRDSMRLQIAVQGKLLWWRFLYPCRLTGRSFLGSISKSLHVWGTTRRVQDRCDWDSVCHRSINERKQTGSRCQSITMTTTESTLNSSVLNPPVRFFRRNTWYPHLRKA